MGEAGFQPYVVRNRRTGPYTYDLWITDHVAEAWYCGERLEMPEVLWCLAHIREGMTIADCGAHHGCLTVVFSKAVGPAGRVAAWEALPKNAAVIERNLRLNQCTNVIVRPHALGERRERMPLLVSDGGDTVLLRDRPEGDKTAAIEVDCVRLDDEVPRDVRLDFIKIDVEGSDVQAMRGGRRVLSQRPIIDLELHNHLYRDRIATLSEIFGMLAPLEYVYSVLPDPCKDTVHAAGWHLDLAELAAYDNPHVFCLPVWAQTAPTAAKRRWWRLGR